METHTSHSRTRRPLLGTVDVAVSIFVIVGVWIALPSRWWVVDVTGSLVAAGFFVSGLDW